MSKVHLTRYRPQVRSIYARVNAKQFAMFAAPYGRIQLKAAEPAALPYFDTFANAALIRSMPISLPDSSSAFRTAFEASPAL